MKKLTLVATLLAYAALTALVVMNVGLDIFSPLLRTWEGRMVVGDLLVMFTLAAIWIWHDAHAAGRNAWLWIAITVLAGAGGPLLYLATRRVADGATGRVSMRESIDIARSANEVFDYVSVGTTDPQWRTEVDRMDVSGPVALGTQWKEFSSFFRFFHTVTPVSVIALEPGRWVVVQTPEGHPSWLQSIREVEPLGPGASRLTYQLAFDLIAFKQMSPIIPPASFVTWWYGRRIRRYLANAKNLLENRATP